jgi:hypothetical protein
MITKDEIKMYDEIFFLGVIKEKLKIHKNNHLELQQIELLTSAENLP